MMDGLIKNECCNQIGAAERLTIRETLETKKSKLLSEIAKVDEALEALNKNPGFEQCFDLVGRVIR